MQIKIKTGNRLTFFPFFLVRIKQTLRTRARWAQPTLKFPSGGRLGNRPPV